MSGTSLFKRETPHPAPFPVSLTERFCKLVNGIIGDPFAGSGTVGVAAHNLGYPFLLSNASASYKEMFSRSMLWK